jgi:hypothetical protein
VSKPSTLFKVGDIVCHKAAFLRSIGWYLDVPRDGRVTAVGVFSGGQLLSVDWSDDIGSTKCLGSNVILASRKHLEPN